ncbi:MAG: PP2C family protein-serine/threonine phosphatase [Acidobacteriota bacterium]|nr:MAG: PP2C family protein-serine/threonine phosphatase [Acidobacteriota bacterium]
MLRGQITDIIIGSIFLFIGLMACSIGAVRRQQGARIFIWLGIWSAMYGAVQLTQLPAVLESSPRWLQIAAPYANTAMMYLLVVFGSLSFLELSRGPMRYIILAIASAGLIVAVAGIAFFVFTGSNDRLMLFNNLLATGALLLLTTVVAVPALSNIYLILPDRGVLAFGTLAFTIEALYSNLARSLSLPTPRILDHLGFGILLFSFGYVALQMVFASERRLLSIENELEIAREIQTSILPQRVPDLEDLRISAAYLPMTAVAGDFYEFIHVDSKRLGILVADVSGHGVPAALIASMIKVAMQSVIDSAHDPRSVLRGLNRVLSGQLRGQFVSVAYLWLDTGKREALYSAAGHPPLLRWRQGSLERIESNGMIIGVLPDWDDYPVYSMSIDPGDRLLLSTDGVTEPENPKGEAFGDARLEQVVGHHTHRPPSELSGELLSELRRWQGASISQQDDITLVIVDVV